MKTTKFFLFVSLLILAGCTTLDGSKKSVKEGYNSISLARVSGDGFGYGCDFNLRTSSPVDFLKGKDSNDIYLGKFMDSDAKRNIKIHEVEPGKYHFFLDCGQRKFLVTNLIVTIPSGGKKVYIGDIYVKIHDLWAEKKPNSIGESVSKTVGDAVTLPFKLAEAAVTKKGPRYKLEIKVTDNMQDALKDYDKYFGADNIPAVKSLAIKTDERL